MLAIGKILCYSVVIGVVACIDLILGIMGASRR